MKVTMFLLQDFQVGKTKFCWNDQAEHSFTTLKRLFSSAPILHSPDPDRQFIVEVDASSTGSGAVLSQRKTEGKTHPCAFFSKSLSPAERNYGVGEWELWQSNCRSRNGGIGWRAPENLFRFGQTIKTWSI